jgi:uncharacterized protein DUF4115
VAAALLVGGYALFRYSHRAADLSSSLPAAISASPPAATSTPAAPAPVSPPPPEANAGNAAPPVAHPDLKKHRARTTAANGGNAAAQANAGNSTPPTATSAAPPTAPTSTPDEAPAPTAQPSTGATNATASQPASAPAGAAVAVPPPGQGLVLQIAATEPVWVSVDADGKTSLQRVLRAHETAKLKAQDAFDVTTGDAQSLVLTLNGETLKPLGGKGEVKKVHLTREDVKAPSP